MAERCTNCGNEDMKMVHYRGKAGWPIYAVPTCMNCGYEIWPTNDRTKPEGVVKVDE